MAEWDAMTRWRGDSADMRLAAKWHHTVGSSRNMAAGTEVGERVTLT